MATIGNTVTTWSDLAKTLDPNGKPARIINLMAQTNHIIQDMSAMHGNLPTGHLASVLVGLPAPTWRKLNGGSIPATDSHAQLTEQCGLLDAWNEVDAKLAKLSGDVNKFRFNKAKSHLEAMAQEWAQTTWYGSRATPEEFVGLAPRYSTLSAAADISQNVINGGGAGSDNTSIWLISPGEERITYIVPQGSEAGIQHVDKGIETKENAGGVTGALQDVYRDHFMLDVGLAVIDWRYAVRICNIDISNLISKSSAADLPELMINATYRLPEDGQTRAFWYMNRTVLRMLVIQCRDDVQNGGQLDWDTVDGKRIRTFCGYPIRLSDQLLNSETLVS